jgi:hypothetical protein
VYVLHAALLPRVGLEPRLFEFPENAFPLPQATMTPRRDANLPQGSPEVFSEKGTLRAWQPEQFEGYFFEIH